MMKFNEKMLDLYLVAGTQNVHGDCDLFLKQIEIACQTGISAFQYREKGNGSLAGAARVSMGRKVRDLVKKYQIPFIVDDDFQLAKALEADGIHVGQSDITVEKISANADNMFIGLSISNEKELAESQRLSRVSYLGVGPIFPTRSKNDANPPIGIDRLAKIGQSSALPIVAIGGISTQNAKQVRQTGLAGVAIISAIMQSSNMAQTIKSLKGELL
ncbi:thiamine phosphate synthase [Oenococcus sicerae]|nr:thiamine phosphate synthase [Oenococcus sicerae]